LECSNAFIQQQSIPEPAWVLPSVSVLSSELVGESGSSQNRAEVRRFTLRFQEQTEDESKSAELVPVIVLVEDNPADVELVRVSLEEHGVSCDLLVIHNGDRACTFLEAIERGEQSCPDLFIIDLNLPKKSGVEILHRMRASAICQHVPVVVLTSSDSPKDKAAVAPFHPSRYIRKPSQLEDCLKLGATFKSLLYGR
jgi:two-component system, chemotaxis family, response regulator Rcp1